MHRFCAWSTTRTTVYLGVAVHGAEVPCHTVGFGAVTAARLLVTAGAHVLDADGGGGLGESGARCALEEARLRVKRELATSTTVSLVLLVGALDGAAHHGTGRLHGDHAVVRGQAHIGSVSMAIFCVHQVCTRVNPVVIRERGRLRGHEDASRDHGKGAHFPTA